MELYAIKKAESRHIFAAFSFLRPIEQLALIEGELASYDFVFSPAISSNRNLADENPFAFVDFKGDIHFASIIVNIRLGNNVSKGITEVRVLIGISQSFSTKRLGVKYF